MEPGNITHSAHRIRLFPACYHRRMGAAAHPFIHFPRYEERFLYQIDEALRRRRRRREDPAAFGLGDGSERSKAMISLLLGMGPPYDAVPEALKALPPPPPMERGNMRSISNGAAAEDVATEVSSLADLLALLDGSSGRDVAPVDLSLNVMEMRKLKAAVRKAVRAEEEAREQQ